MPLSELPHLLSYAEERETDHLLMPLWLANYAVAKLTEKDAISYQSLLSQVMGEGVDRNQTKRTPEEIEFDFEAVIRRDRQTVGKEE